MSRDHLVSLNAVAESQRRAHSLQITLADAPPSVRPTLSNMPHRPPPVLPVIQHGLPTVSIAERPFDAADDAQMLVLDQQYPGGRYKLIGRSMNPLRKKHEVKARLMEL